MYFNTIEKKKQQLQCLESSERCSSSLFFVLHYLPNTLTYTQSNKRSVSWAMAIKEGIIKTVVHDLVLKIVCGYSEKRVSTTNLLRNRIV